MTFNISFCFYSTAFLFYRGRTYVYLDTKEAHCRQMTFSNSIFLAHKPIHVQLAVNYFNTSGQFTHEAAVAWTENVSPTKFLICALTSGRLDRLPPDGGLTFVDFIAYQGNPVGSVTGHEILPSWWDGTTCKEVALPQVRMISFENVRRNTVEMHEKWPQTVFSVTRV